MCVLNIDRGCAGTISPYGVVTALSPCKQRTGAILGDFAPPGSLRSGGGGLSPENDVLKHISSVKHMDTGRWDVPRVG